MDIAGKSWLIVGVYTAVIVLVIGVCLVRYSRRSRAALREHHRRMALFAEQYDESDDESCVAPEQAAEGTEQRERDTGNDDTPTT